MTGSFIFVITMKMAFQPTYKEQFQHRFDPSIFLFSFKMIIHHKHLHLERHLQLLTFFFCMSAYTSIFSCDILDQGWRGRVKKFYLPDPTNFSAHPPFVNVVRVAKIWACRYEMTPIVTCLRGWHRHLGHHHLLGENLLRMISPQTFKKVNSARTFRRNSLV